MDLHGYSLLFEAQRAHPLVFVVGLLLAILAYFELAADAHGSLVEDPAKGFSAPSTCLLWILALTQYTLQPYTLDFSTQHPVNMLYCQLNVMQNSKIYPIPRIKAFAIGPPETDNVPISEAHFVWRTPRRSSIICK